MEGFERTVSLIGEQSFAELRAARVLVVGVGGVGGAAAEALARSGVGALRFADGDVFEPSNLNRQILCTQATLGKNKAVCAAERVKDIFPGTVCEAFPVYFCGQTADELLSSVDFVIDAIDDVKNKILLITECAARNIPIVSAMGAGNRLECDFYVTDIYKTANDPLAKKLRHELKKAGVGSLEVVCSRTPPAVKNAMPLSVAPPPFVMGALLANCAIKRIAGL